MEPPQLFQVERDGNTLIVSPAVDLSELRSEQLQGETNNLLGLFEQEQARNLIVDFQNTDYFGSDALYTLIRFWKRVCSRKGRMVLCNLSDHERDILKASVLDKLWPICSSRKEALEAVKT